MLYILLSTVILAGYCDRAARKSRIEMLSIETRFRLFGIRDELRNAAIDGRLERDNWFEYFDTTLTKIIDLLPILSVWQIATMLFHYRNDRTSERHIQELTSFLDQDENEEFRRLYSRFAKVVGAFLIRRHRIMGTLLRVIGKAADGASNVKQDATQIVATAPETSTFLTYCEG